MMLKKTMLAALRSVRERWLRPADAWESATFDHRLRQELGLPPRDPQNQDWRGPGWF